MNNLEYKVKHIASQSLAITRRCDAKQWSVANTLEDFVSPWDLAPIKPIAFRALYDSEYFYFSFNVQDGAVFTELKDDSKASIAESDRVELFMRADSRMSPYYCLEIDTKPRIMDFKAMPNRDFDLSWNWPKDQIEVKSIVLSDSFSVAGKISLKSLEELHLLKKDSEGTFMEIGVYRAKYTTDDAGYNHPTWITWVDPKTPRPDFHIPESFGIFRFES
ncbi:Carbohydrate family 9 binding domain-like [Leeuwenhoekiella marinoflava DSM 3653]|uniref:Carbohydrate binding protein with CBM9 domain n=3 Tax=Leeuwenhoekiella marinoflava TaxID=988 RepID=A0A4Q0PST8_9FLAO|nr:carbohydrate binding protein with CBM9 domain [Leeuwenhoekiella marinoflava]SHE36563.1 Carbohydrate family 9 binding domain-like [Leeuwenhoekiella marinoflava DSM 3653]